MQISAVSHFAGNDPHYGRQLYKRAPEPRALPGFSDVLDKAVDVEKQQNRQIRQIRLMVRELAWNGVGESEAIPVMAPEEEEEDPLSANPQELPRKQFTGTIRDKEQGYFDLRDTKESSEDHKSKKPVIYNYRDVATKIQRAKTSSAAGRAVFSAKRKVLELKRKVASGDGDPEELQLALSHAKRMELTARKKKRHLEMEELATVCQKRDERQEDSSSDLKNQFFIIKEEELTEKEDGILKTREELLGEVMDEAEAAGETLTDELAASLNEAISELGEEELEMLEEAMELLENMELMDPHMSEEELEELKRKHRDAENKAMLKADMDYLKGLMKHLEEKGGSPQQGMLLSGSSQSSMGVGGISAFGVSGAEPVSAGVSVDIQL